MSTPWPPAIDSPALAGHVGRQICLTGRVAVNVWQHLVGTVADKSTQYFDLADGGQLVVHAAEPLPSGAELELLGRVLEVRGSSKRPGKVDETYVEYALDVDAWRHRP